MMQSIQIVIRLLHLPKFNHLKNFPSSSETGTKNLPTFASGEVPFAYNSQFTSPVFADRKGTKFTLISLNTKMVLQRKCFFVKYATVRKRISIFVELTLK